MNHQKVIPFRVAYETDAVNDHRRQQQEHHRRSGDDETPRRLHAVPDRPGQSPAQSRNLEGHERRLMHWLNDGGQATLQLMGEETITGRVVGFDKATITIDEHGTGNRDDSVTVFKHDISTMRYSA